MLYLEIKARGGSQTWTVVYLKVDIVIYVANSIFTKKIPCGGFSQIRSHKGSSRNHSGLI